MSAKRTARKKKETPISVFYAAHLVHEIHDMHTRITYLRERLLDIGFECTAADLLVADEAVLKSSIAATAGMKQLQKEADHAHD